MPKTKTNRQPFDVIQPGEKVVLLTYMVGLVPDGKAEFEYEPIPVHLRKRPEAVAELNTREPNEDLRKEILRRADKLERREHPTSDDTTFEIGTLRLVRQRLDVAR